MSHRTHHLSPTNRFNRVIRELRYHEASRQLLAIVLVVLFSIAGKPKIISLYYIGAVVAVIGLLIRLWASGHVKKNKVLATDGPYFYVRHPLYVGNILLLAGYALASELWWSVPLLVGFLYFYYPTAIDYEDRKLHRLFGSSWEAWSREVHALIPRLRPRLRTGQTHGSGDWSFRQSLRQNGEPLIIAFLLYWLYHLYSQLP